MKLCPVVLWFVLTVLWKAVNSLETVEELLCQNMEAGSRIPHPEFCNVYIVCTDNAAMQISCERQILYNPETEICDPDFHVCRGGFIKSPDGEALKYEEETEVDYEEEKHDEEAEYEAHSSAKTESDDIHTTETNALTTKHEPTSASTERITPPVAHATPPIQLAEPSHSGCPKVDSDKLLLISHPTKCSIYYVCYHGKPVPMECSLGLYWSEKNYKCVPRELSECQARSSDPYPRCPRDGIDFLPDEKNCQRFWFCRNGHRMLQQCDAFFHWDVNERKCKRIGQSVCYLDLLKTLSV